jgi:hypothetical protein
VPDPKKQGPGAGVCRPAGTGADKQSLRDFAEEKKPTNNDHRNALIVYYMAEILGMSTANIGQVLVGRAGRAAMP